MNCITTKKRILVAGLILGIVVSLGCAKRLEIDKVKAGVLIKEYQRLEVFSVKLLGRELKLTPRSEIAAELEKKYGSKPDEKWVGYEVGPIGIIPRRWDMKTHTCITTNKYKIIVSEAEQEIPVKVALMSDEDWSNPLYEEVQKYTSPAHFFKTAPIVCIDHLLKGEKEYRSVQGQPVVDDEGKTYLTDSKGNRLLIEPQKSNKVEGELQRGIEAFRKEQNDGDEQKAIVVGELASDGKTFLAECFFVPTEEGYEAIDVRVRQ